MNDKKASINNEISHLQKSFVHGVKQLMEPIGWGAQKKIAELAGIRPSFLNDILKGRKFGSERTRRAIATALDATYEEVLEIGDEKVQDKTSLIGQQCGDHPMFSEARACCIYQYAAEKSGLMRTHFFTDDALKHVRPPGWVEYLNHEIDEDELLEKALKEMNKFRA